MMIEKIIRNRIKCLKCGAVIESHSVHDFVECPCGACAVDGGKLYLRRSGERTDWEEMSVTEVVEESSFDDCKRFYQK